MGDQEKSWAPHIVCQTRNAYLRGWSLGKRKGLAFVMPMILRELQNDINDCYFCMVKTKDLIPKKANIVYPSLQSAIRPVLHSTDIPVPVVTNLPGIYMVDNDDDDTPKSKATRDCDFRDEDCVIESESPKLFSQSELNNLVRDLSLSKESSELLASRLKEKNLLLPGARISFYRTKESKLLQYFDNKGSFVNCSNIPNLLIEMGILQYSPEKSKLLIDNFEQSLKCVLYRMEISMTQSPLLIRSEQRGLMSASKSFWSRLATININGSYVLILKWFVFFLVNRVASRCGSKCMESICQCRHKFLR